MGLGFIDERPETKDYLSDLLGEVNIKAGGEGGWCGRKKVQAIGSRPHHPGGMFENSPAIYRREDSQNCPSSEGTAEVLPPSFQPSLRDFMGDGKYPEITSRDAFATKYEIPASA
jgi:hypothetical protein